MQLLQLEHAKSLQGFLLTGFSNQVNKRLGLFIFQVVERVNAFVFSNVTQLVFNAK